MDDDFERVLCAKNEVFVYKIPPRQSARGYRAADWKLDAPDWTGRFRILSKGKSCIIKFEDKFTGALFAQSHITEYPGSTVEAVLDSSRYFVIKIEDESGRHAFIGIGFADRGDSFDFNVTLQDYFKKEKQVEDIKNEEPSVPLDLGFKEGQTIKISLGNRDLNKPKKKPTGNASMGILPPPPGGISSFPAPPGGQMIAPPPSAAGQPRSPPAQNAPQTVKNNDPFGIAVNDPFVSAYSVDPFGTNSEQTMQQPSMRTPQAAVDWGDFASSNESGSSAASSSNWVQF